MNERLEAAFIKRQELKDQKVLDTYRQMAQELTDSGYGWKPLGDTGMRGLLITNGIWNVKENSRIRKLIETGDDLILTFSELITDSVIVLTSEGELVQMKRFPDWTASGTKLSVNEYRDRFEHIQKKVGRIIERGQVQV